MNITELRIGSWVHHKAVWSARNNDFNASEPLTDFDYQIEPIDFYYDVECRLSIENDLEPIPLTEEWLKRFGFATFYCLDEYDNEQSYYGYCDLPERWIFELSDDFYFRAYDKEDIGKRKTPLIQIKVETVHHLQNLFFDLTKQELNAKEI